MYIVGQQNDVIVEITSASRYQGNDTYGENRVRVYDAVVYSQLQLPFQFHGTAKYPDTLRNLPLCGIEQLTIHSANYDEWLAGFIAGEKGMELMRARLLESMSTGLRKLLTESPLSIRVWWSATTPELDDLPWELTVDAGRRDGAHRVAFLRGLPPETPIPTLPLLHRAPRLGMIGARQLWPSWAHSLKAEMGNTVVAIDGSLRFALAQAISEGIEFVHVFADGVVSAALEGILYDHSIDLIAGTPEMSTGELSRMLNGSRVAVLALSPADYGNPDTMPIAGRSVLSAYRAFAYIGSSLKPLPTVLAPLGPIPDDMMATFWSVFYNELSTSWHLTESLRRAQAVFSFSMPVALFCRHAGGKLFESASTDSKSQPMQVRADLLRSQQLTSELSRIGTKYGFDLPPAAKALFENETSRQSQLRGDLDSWIDRSEDI